MVLTFYLVSAMAFIKCELGLPLANCAGICFEDGFLKFSHYLILLRWRSAIQNTRTTASVTHESAAWNWKSCSCTSLIILIERL